MIPTTERARVKTLKAGTVRVYPPADRQMLLANQQKEERGKAGVERVV